MRIVFTSPRYEPLLGGVETHTRELAIRLARRDHEVFVVTTNPDRSLPGSETLDGVSVIRVDSWPKRGDPFLTVGTGAKIRAMRPDVVHVQGYQSAFTPMILQTITKTSIPTVMTFHGGANANRLRQSLYPLQRQMLGHLFRRVSAMVVLTRFEREQYSRELRVNTSRFTTIPNGSDLPTPLMPVAEVDSLIGSIGRLDASKGHDRVIRAFSILCADRPQARLRIVGRGPDRELLQSLAERSGVASKVEFVSFDSSQREEFAACILECALFVAMGTAETQPISVLEVAALGRSVGVLTSSAGMRELVEDRVAWAIESGIDDKSLARQIDGALQHPQPPDASNLRTWEQIVTATEKLYQSLISH